MWLYTKFVFETPDLRQVEDYQSQISVHMSSFYNCRATQPLNGRNIYLVDTTYVKTLESAETKSNTGNDEVTGFV